MTQPSSPSPYAPPSAEVAARSEPPTLQSNRRWAIGILVAETCVQAAGVGLTQFSLPVLVSALGFVLAAFGLWRWPRVFRWLAPCAPLVDVARELYAWLVPSTLWGTWRSIMLLNQVLVVVGLAALLWGAPGWLRRKLAVGMCLAALGPLVFAYQLYLSRASRPNAPCTERVARLAPRLRYASRTRTLRLVGENARLPAAPSAVLTSLATVPGAVLVIGATEATLDTLDLGKDTAVRANALREQLEAHTPSAVYVAIEPGLPSATALPLLRALEWRNVYFMVKGAPGGQLVGRPPAGAREFASKLDAAASVLERATIAGTLLADLVSPCASARELTGRPRIEPETGHALWEHTLAVVGDCGCHEVDMDALEYVALRGDQGQLPMPQVWSVPITPAWLEQIEAQSQQGTLQLSP